MAEASLKDCASQNLLSRDEAEPDMAVSSGEPLPLNPSGYPAAVTAGWLHGTPGPRAGRQIKLKMPPL